MSFPGAVIAGLVATFVFFVLTRLFTMNLMGMERYLGTMFTRRESPVLGFLLLFAWGVIFSLIYAGLWSIGIGWPGYRFGLLFGVIQWLVVGSLIGALPLVHAGIRAGVVPPPGAYMIRLLGPAAFLAGLSSHAIFGLAVAYFYQFFRTRYA